MNRTFDYIPRLDPRNKLHRVTAADPALLQKAKFWTPGFPVLNQGAEGACVGFGVTGEAMASPVRVKFPFTGGKYEPVDYANTAARYHYQRAKEIDEWEGVDYEGTSVRAGMLVGRERNWWSGFRWAMNMAELRAALEEGPVVIGLEWYSGMYEAPKGILTAVGTMVGWHCILVTGYTPRHRLLKQPAYRLRNSWGLSWGVNGSAYITSDQLNGILFQAGGEAAVAVGRKR